MDIGGASSLGSRDKILVHFASIIFVVVDLVVGSIAIAFQLFGHVWMKAQPHFMSPSLVAVPVRG